MRDYLNGTKSLADLLDEMIDQPVPKLREENETKNMVNLENKIGQVAGNVSLRRSNHEIKNSCSEFNKIDESK